MNPGANTQRLLAAALETEWASERKNTAGVVTGADSRAGRSGWDWRDQGCEMRDLRPWDLEARAEVIEERDLEFGAGLGEAEHDVAGDASSFADRSAGDFSFGDDGADVVFGCVGVEGNLRPLEHAQQFVLVGEEALEEPVERGVSGSAFEDAVEAGSQFGGALWAGVGLERLELAIEPPDHLPGDFDGVALPIVGGNELVDEALGVDPAQSVLAEAELPGVVGKDDGAAEPLRGAERPP